MSFPSKITPREKRVARVIRETRNKLLHVFESEKEQHRFTQAQLARELGVDRSVVNRRLTGQENLTLRSLAELADVLNHQLCVEFVSCAEMLPPTTNEISSDADGFFWADSKSAASSQVEAHSKHEWYVSSSSDSAEVRSIFLDVAGKVQNGDEIDVG